MRPSKALWQQYLQVALTGTKHAHVLHEMDHLALVHVAISCTRASAMKSRCQMYQLLYSPPTGQCMTGVTAARNIAIMRPPHQFPPPRMARPPAQKRNGVTEQFVSTRQTGEAYQQPPGMLRNQPCRANAQQRFQDRASCLQRHAATKRWCIAHVG